MGCLPIGIVDHEYACHGQRLDNLLGAFDQRIRVLGRFVIVCEELETGGDGVARALQNI